MHRLQYQGEAPTSGLVQTLLPIMHLYLALHLNVAFKIMQQSYILHPSSEFFVILATY